MSRRAIPLSVQRKKNLRKTISHTLQFHTMARPVGEKHVSQFFHSRNARKFTVHNPCGVTSVLNSSWLKYSHTPVALPHFTEYWKASLCAKKFRLEGARKDARINWLLVHTLIKVMGVCAFIALYQLFVAVATLTYGHIGRNGDMLSTFSYDSSCFQHRVFKTNQLSGQKGTVDDYFLLHFHIQPKHTYKLFPE